MSSLLRSQGRRERRPGGDWVPSVDRSGNGACRPATRKGPSRRSSSSSSLSDKGRLEAARSWGRTAGSGTGGRRAPDRPPHGRAGAGNSCRRAPCRVRGSTIWSGADMGAIGQADDTKTFKRLFEILRRCYAPPRFGVKANAGGIVLIANGAARGCPAPPARLSSTAIRHACRGGDPGRIVHGRVPPLLLRAISGRVIRPWRWRVPCGNG